ncbi:hypothetical protein GQ457_06G020040 [Hibiscus cannabinus]
MVARISEATFENVFERKKIATYSYLGGCDPTGKNLQMSHKKEAAKQCDCTLLDVENSLAKFIGLKKCIRRWLS